MILALAMVAFVAAGASGAQTGAAAKNALKVIRAGTLIDGTGDAPKKNRLIFVRGGKIEKVTDGAAAIPAGADQGSTRTPFQKAMRSLISAAAGLGSG